MLKLGVGDDFKFYKESANQEQLSKANHWINAAAAGLCWLMDLHRLNPIFLLAGNPGRSTLLVII